MLFMNPKQNKVYVISSGLNALKSASGLRYLLPAEQLISRYNEERYLMIINIRTVAAFREIGKGFAAIETICGIMNMPQPMNRTTFQDCIDSMHPAYVNTAEHSMNNAASQLSVNQDSDVI